MVRYAFPALMLLSILVACGGDDGTSGGDDASNADATGAGDAGVPDSGNELTCDVTEDCPCFSNYDCPTAYACTSLDATGDSVFCIEGPRGTGIAGDSCTDEADCDSALCIEANAGSFCSGLCETGATCPAVLPQCLFIGFGADVFICAP